LEKIAGFSGKPFRKKFGAKIRVLCQICCLFSTLLLLGTSAGAETQAFNAKALVGRDMSIA
jgi:hypothetical protein